MKKSVWILLFTSVILLCGCSEKSENSGCIDSVSSENLSDSVDDLISNPKNQVGNGYVIIHDEASFPAWVSEFRYGDGGNVIDFWGREVFSVTEKDLLFSCGISAHRFENGLYGYLNMNGETVIEPKYSEARPFVNGTALVAENGKQKYIDMNGNQSADKTHEGYHGDMTKHDWYGPFTGQYLVYQDADRDNAKVYYGYSDASGNDTAMPDVSKAYSFSNGFALIERENGEFYFIDERLQRVTDFSDEIEDRISRKGIAYTLWEGDLMLGNEYVFDDGYFVLNIGSAREPRFELIKILPKLYQP